MDTILHLIFALIALGVLIFVHELGHYWVARRCGMKVEVFSIGFGRPITSWMHQDVRWQIGWVPFGGYVKIAGMELGKEDPNKIPGGFFTKKPWARLKVALAGPLANLLLAFVLFLVIWGTGGREKPLSEFTHRVGAVDTHSQLYAMGLRPGDIINEYDGRSYGGIKDLFFAAMFSEGPVMIKGVHVNQQSGEEMPFQYSVKPYQQPLAQDGIRTLGVTAAARDFIYDKSAALLPGSPLKESGIEYGDRLVFANGEVIYSLEQLSGLLNDNRALLTVQRGGATFLARVPRVTVSELRLLGEARGELLDCQHEAQLKGRLCNLIYIPYNVSDDLFVEGPLGFIDPDTEIAFSSSSPLTMPLEVGDRILAIDGIPIKNSRQLLKIIQHPHAILIVERGFVPTPKLTWENPDQDFLSAEMLQKVALLSRSLGTDYAQKQFDNLVVLNPVEPKSPLDFAFTEEEKEEFLADMARTKEQIEEIPDPQKRKRALEAFEENKKRLVLGVYFQDEQVQYNPGPQVLFTDVFLETWRTLAALFGGNLNPKWLAGPVGIVQVIQHGWAVSVKEALFWVAVISVNLGLLNLLPIPVLDGGYIVLALWEMITGKRPSPKTLQRIIIPFVVLLIAFFIFVTYWDLHRLF